MTFHGGRAEVGLFEDQHDRYHHQYQCNQVVMPAQAAAMALEIPGHHHRQGYFHDFGRLDADAEVQPAGGAVYGNAEKMHAQQQQYAENVGGRCKGSQCLRLDAGNNPQQDKADDGVYGLAFQPADVLAVGRVEQEQAHDVDDQHGVKEPGIHRIPNQAFEFQ